MKKGDCWPYPSPCLSGCSPLFIDGPPPGHADMESFECTESRLLPILDLGFTAMYLGEAATAEGSFLVTKGIARAIGIGFVVLTGVSAITGFKRVNRCRAARRQGPQNLGIQLEDRQFLSHKPNSGR